MEKIVVELSGMGKKVDLMYELTIIMSHLNHDGRIHVTSYHLYEDVDYEEYGYIKLLFNNALAKNEAWQILKNRGYILS